MKQLILTTLMASISFASVAAEETIIRTDNMIARHVVDEFSGEVETCGLYIGKPIRGNAYMLSINSGTVYSLSGSAGSYSASGYMMKIDDGEVYNKGRSSRGGEAVFGTLTDTMMDELSKGQKLVIRAYPENQFADTITSTYDLSGSAEVVQAYKDCAAGL